MVIDNIRAKVVGRTRYSRITSCGKDYVMFFESWFADYIQSFSSGSPFVGPPLFTLFLYRRFHCILYYFSLDLVSFVLLNEIMLYFFWAFSLKCDTKFIGLGFWQRSISNGKSSKSVGGTSSRSPCSTASRRGSEKRSSTTMVHAFHPKVCCHELLGLVHDFLHHNFLYNILYMIDLPFQVQRILRLSVSVLFSTLELLSVVSHCNAWPGLIYMPACTWRWCRVFTTLTVLLSVAALAYNWAFRY